MTELGSQQQIRPGLAPDLRSVLRQELRSAAQRGDAAQMLACTRRLVEHGKETDLTLCASLLAKNADALVKQCGLKRCRLFLVRSVTLEPVLASLKIEALLSGYVLEVELGAYGSYAQEMLDPESALGRADPELVCVSLDLEDIAGRLPELCATGHGEGAEQELNEAVTRVGQVLRTYRAGNRGKLILQGCLVPGETSLGMVAEANLPSGSVAAVRELNRRLAELCRTIPDCAFFDVDQAASEFGRARWRDARMFLAARLPLSPEAFRPFARGLWRTAMAMLRPARKVLCTDLDDTLWGGVLGEEGANGIATGGAFPGNAYREYQRYLKQLAARGILLALVSKNNPADVQEAFRMRAADLDLQLSDLVATRIGWGEKTEALRDLARELSLGLDAFVFVDDNPVECEAVRMHLPEVAVLQFPAEEPWLIVHQLADAALFDAISVTVEDVGRAVQYKAQARREELSRGTTTKEEFLQSLGIVCTFLSAVEAPLARSVQLLAKTNQFNLTTRRYTASEVESFATEPGRQAVAVRVRDRFGDAGVVGLALARERADCCYIESLLLSCRVIGRGIETALLAVVAKQAARSGCRWLIGEFVPTEKNAPCADFYPRHGFERDADIGGDGAIIYRLDLTVSLPAMPAWLTLEGASTYELEHSAVLAS